MLVPFDTFANERLLIFHHKNHFLTELSIGFNYEINEAMIEKYIQIFSIPSKIVWVSVRASIKRALNVRGERNVIVPLRLELISCVDIWNCLWFRFWRSFFPVRSTFDGLRYFWWRFRSGQPMSVFTSMTDQLIILNESFVANVAMVSLFAGVITHVRPKRWVLAERAIANATMVWTLASVCPEMRSWIDISHTKINAVNLHRLVRSSPHMNIQFIIFDEAFAARFARVTLHRIVLLFMYS